MGSEQLNRSSLVWWWGTTGTYIGRGRGRHIDLSRRFRVPKTAARMILEQSLRLTYLDQSDMLNCCLVPARSHSTVQSSRRKTRAHTTRASATLSINALSHDRRSIPADSHLVPCRLITIPSWFSRVFPHGSCQSYTLIVFSLCRPSEPDPSTTGQRRVRQGHILYKRYSGSRANVRRHDTT